MTANADGPIVLVINREGMGSADTELRHKLVQTFLNMIDLDEKRELPGTICFYGSGVKLAVTGSPVLEELKSLEARGVELIVCSTCLNYYESQDLLRVGTAGGMKDIVDRQWAAAKVITL